MTTPQDATEALARALRTVFIADIETGEPPSDATLLGFATLIAAALTADGWSVVRTEDRRPHPDANHEFRNVCQRCGEHGYLHVAVITDLEVVRIEPRAALGDPS